MGAAKAAVEVEQTAPAEETPETKPETKPDSEAAPQGGAAVEVERVEDGSLEVVVLVQISGTRNGEAWPAAGESWVLPEAEALAYVKSGYVRLPDAE